MKQIPLGIRLREGVNFASFHPGANREALHALRHGGQQFVYLWGPAGSGKSHLLQALVGQAAEQGERCAYLSLQDSATAAPEYLRDLERLALVCIDDLDRIAGQPHWEEALFHLYNRIRATTATRLVLTARSAPAEIPVALPDLRSRLGWGLVLKLTPLDDAARLTVLQQRAAARGMDLPREVGNYLLQRVSRDMGTLAEWLDRLDRSSLAAQRKLTIPFVRKLLLLEENSDQ